MPVAVSGAAFQTTPVAKPLNTLRVSNNNRYEVVKRPSGGGATFSAAD
ncbi:MAG: hypothetical protein LBL06_02370 [Treponema sp.]|nr:hypothetical protein [Treponema sp.]